MKSKKSSKKKSKKSKKGFGKVSKKKISKSSDFNWFEIVGQFEPKQAD